MLSFESFSFHQLNPLSPQGEHRDAAIPLKPGLLLGNVIIDKNEFARCSISYFVFIFYFLRTHFLPDSTIFTLSAKFDLVLVHLSEQQMDVFF